MGNHVGFRAALPTFKKKRRGKKLGIYELLDLVSVWTDAKKVGLESFAMGAYLSQPITKKEIGVEEDDNFWVSSTSMQGWRVSQEDAHNAILNYDDYSSLFAVYDGHGGHEVAAYTAKKLPNYIKCRKDYRMGNIEQGLTEAFVEFDRTLTEQSVVRELRIIAGKEVDPDEEVDHKEVDDLFQEATMPIEAVMAQNGSSDSDNTEIASSSVKEEDDDQSTNKNTSTSSSITSSISSVSTEQPKAKTTALTHFKTRNGGGKFKSPAIRAKPARNPDDDPYQRMDDKIRDASGVDNVKHLSFSESMEQIRQGFKDHCEKDELSKNNGDHDNDKETADKPTNGHHEAKSDEKVHINGESNNGVSQPESSEVTTDVKGKGKGKGKGKSSQIVKPKSDGDNDVELTTEVHPEPSKEAKISPNKKAKSAAELYQNLVNDEVMEEESSDDDDDEDAFGELDSDSDSDEDEDSDVELEKEPIGSEDDTEELPSSDDTPDTDEEEDDDDDGELIGGDFNEEPGNDSGCTAVVALLVGQELFVANAGDSRCVVCRDGKAIEMSFDHKPEDDPERDRITKAGGRVTPDGRVNGGLNLSRAIGDHAYKTNKNLPLSEQMISPVPDVKRLTINPKTDSFISLACDGIWNSLNSQEVVDFINERLNNNDQKDEKSDPMDTDRLTKVLGELFDHCLAPDTMGDGTGCDNMTAVIAKLKPNAFREGKDKVICDESIKEEKE